MKKFQRQLPDALELIARALRAGHAFSSGMKLAADEFDDPLGPEFAETLDEVNFGISVSDALKNLSSRIDCPDLKYFVVSVILQRETGGNLAEIIDSMAHLIRERFKLQGRIRVLAAEGKFSAIILLLLPFFVVVALRFVRPDYMTTLVTDPIGKVMASAGVFLMIIGRDQARRQGFHLNNFFHGPAQRRRQGVCIRIAVVFRYPGFFGLQRFYFLLFLLGQPNDGFNPQLVDHGAPHPKRGKGQPGNSF